MATSVLVGMSEIQILKGSGQLTCLGLGSCIGLCGLDPVANVAGMVHVMLPEAFKDRPVDKPGKFADTGVVALVKLLERTGANISRTKFAMAGGAQVFKFNSGQETKLDIGNRNAIQVIQNLHLLGIRPIAADVGGTQGRTVVFTVETGQVRVRSVATGEKVLCTLRG